MNERNRKGNGEDLRLQLVLPLDSGGRRSMTATVSMTTLDEDQRARFEAEVEILLTQFVRQQVKVQEG